MGYEHSDYLVDQTKVSKTEWQTRELKIDISIVESQVLPLVRGDEICKLLPVAYFKGIPCWRWSLSPVRTFKEREALYKQIQKILYNTSFTCILQDNKVFWIFLTEPF